MNEHPHELLAEYVDGTLTGEARTRVETHVSSCSICREEVELAGEAAAVLSALPEVTPPFGMPRPAVGRTPRRWTGPAAWRAAAVAAALVAVAGTTVVLTRGQGDRSAGTDAAAPAQDPSRGAAPGGAQSQADTQEGEAVLTAGDAARYPRYERSGLEYTVASLNDRSRAVADEARTAMAEGFPSTGLTFYQTVDLEALPAGAERAVGCVTQGAPPDRTLAPFVIEVARFEDEPAYIVTFLAGASPQSRFDRIQVFVAARATCTIRHFARVSL